MAAPREDSGDAQKRAAEALRRRLREEKKDLDELLSTMTPKGASKLRAGREMLGITKKGEEVFAREFGMSEGEVRDVVAETAVAKAQYAGVSKQTPQTRYMQDVVTDGAVYAVLERARAEGVPPTQVIEGAKRYAEEQIQRAENPTSNKEEAFIAGMHEDDRKYGAWKYQQFIEGIHNGAPAKPAASEAAKPPEEQKPPAKGGAPAEEERELSAKEKWKRHEGEERKHRREAGLPSEYDRLMDQRRRELTHPHAMTARTPGRHMRANEEFAARERRRGAIFQLIDARDDHGLQEVYEVFEKAREDPEYMRNIARHEPGYLDFLGTVVGVQARPGNPVTPDRLMREVRSGEDAIDRVRAFLRGTQPRPDPGVHYRTETEMTRATDEDRQRLRIGDESYLARFERRWDRISRRLHVGEEERAPERAPEREPEPVRVTPTPRGPAPVIITPRPRGPEEEEAPEAPEPARVRRPRPRTPEEQQSHRSLDDARHNYVEKLQGRRRLLRRTPPAELDKARTEYQEAEDRMLRTVGGAAAAASVAGLAVGAGLIHEGDAVTGDVQRRVMAIPGARERVLADMTTAMVKAKHDEMEQFDRESTTAASEGLGQRLANGFRRAGWWKAGIGAALTAGGTALSLTGVGAVPGAVMAGTGVAMLTEAGWAGAAHRWGRAREMSQTEMENLDIQLTHTRRDGTAVTDYAVTDEELSRRVGAHREAARSVGQNPHTEWGHSETYNALRAEEDRRMRLRARAVLDRELTSGTDADHAVAQTVREGVLDPQKATLEAGESQIDRNLRLGLAKWATAIAAGTAAGFLVHGFAGALAPQAAAPVQAPPQPTVDVVNQFAVHDPVLGPTGGETEIGQAISESARVATQQGLLHADPTAIHNLRYVGEALAQQSGAGLSQVPLGEMYHIPLDFLRQATAVAGNLPYHPFLPVS